MTAETDAILGGKVPARSGTPAKPFGVSWLDDDELVENFLRLLRAGNPIATACGVMGIPRQNFYDAIKIGKANPDHPKYGPFFLEVERSMAAPKARWLQTINKAADKGDWNAALKLLERRDKENFGPQQPDAVGGGTQQVVIELRFPGQPQPEPIDVESEEIEEGEVRELEAGDG